MVREHGQDLDETLRQERLRAANVQADASDREGDRLAEQPPSLVERAGALFAPAPVATRPPKARRGPSDRVLLAVIMARLEDEKSLDLRDVRATVDDAEVTLDGTVQKKADKRRIEDVADLDGVRNVQNNLRVREPGHWTFL